MKYNCFECNENYNHKLCKGYTPDTERYCLWRDVADRDLENHKEGKLVTLRTMLESYLDRTRIITQKEVDEMMK
jgi:hypothetical protein